MSEAELREVGITSFGICRRLKITIEKLNTKAKEDEKPDNSVADVSMHAN